MRFFPKHVEDAATRCSANVITQEPFESNGGPAGGGGTTAVEVTMKESGLKAWAKPARKDPQDENCAAHEKIAADLAYLLGLPVPPVILSRNTQGTPFAEIVSLSYEALPAGRPWATMQAALTPAILDAARPSLSAMWPFHAWIHDTDHSWNDGNAIMEIQPNGSVALAFIDYSFSMTKHWNPVGPAPVDPWANEPGAPYKPCDRPAMAETVAKIEKLSLKDFGRIIERIPDDAMAPALRTQLIAALDGRRSQLRAILKL